MNKKTKNIVGSGFLANQFKQYSNLINKLNICIYVSGVSNSLCINRKFLDRDFNRIKNFIKLINNQKLVYISTCTIFDPSRNKSKYIKNKIKIEKHIRKKVSNYTIIRLPELVGVSKNKNTLTNFLYNNILNSKKFVAYVNSKRNLLDVNDAIKLCFFFLNYSNKKIINIANLKSYNVVDIISIFKNILEILPIYEPKNIKFSNFKLKNSINKNILKKNKIIINKHYLNKIIKKYYA